RKKRQDGPDRVKETDEKNHTHTGYLIESIIITPPPPRHNPPRKGKRGPFFKYLLLSFFSSSSSPSEAEKNSGQLPPSTNVGHRVRAFYPAPSSGFFWGSAPVPLGSRRRAACSARGATHSHNPRAWSRH
ncbi:hypothetical protein L249_4280, partial [Ophiocordyceps polyrhachis-furcata BCC 54312]